MVNRAVPLPQSEFKLAWDFLPRPNNFGRGGCGVGTLERGNVRPLMRRSCQHPLALGPAGQVVPETPVAAVVAQFNVSFQRGGGRFLSTRKALFAGADAQAGAQACAPGSGIAAQALHPHQIARQHVNLEVDAVARFERAERRDRAGVRDQVEREQAGSAGQVVDGVDRQRDALDRDRAFGGDVGGKVSRGGDDDAPRIARRLHAVDGAETVDVAGDDMSAQFIAQFERGFEVELRAGRPQSRHGADLRFARDIDREPGMAGSPAAFNHRQAHARTGNRRADGDLRGIVGARDDRAQVALLDRKSVV